MTSIVEEKRRLRRELRARLSALSPHDLRRAGEDVVATLVDSAVFGDSGGMVAFFASRDDELSTIPLDEHLRRRGHRRCLPRISSIGGAFALEFVVIDDDAPASSLPRDRFGIPTPPGSTIVALSSCDVVVVPGLGFDHGGGRLGYGGGYYDRALVGVDDRAVVGVLHVAQWVEAVPREAHDRLIPRLVAGGEI